MDAGLTTERLGALRAATADVKREVTVTTVFAAVTGRMLEISREGDATFVAADALSSGGASVAVAPPKAAIKTRTKTVGFQVVERGRRARVWHCSKRVCRVLCRSWLAALRRDAMRFGQRSRMVIRRWRG